MTYLLDANVFISAKNAHYGLDFHPGFWDWIAQAHAGGLVYTVQAVAAELADPDRAAWVKSMPTTFSIAPGAEAVIKLAEVSAWCASEARYQPAARTKFLNSADFYLVAQA